MTSLNTMRDSVIGLKHTAMVADEIWEFVSGIDKCATVTDFGFIPLKAICEAIQLLVKVAAYIMRTSIVLALDILSSIYEQKTSSPSDDVDAGLQVQYLSDSFQKFDKWSTVSLETINKNIVTQHTKMRDQLQERHEDMVNSILEITTDGQNNIGTYIQNSTGTLARHHETLNKTLAKNHEILYKLLLDIASDVKFLKKPGFNGINGEQDLMKNELDAETFAYVEVLGDKQAPKISCGFELLSHASDLTMNVAVEDNTTLFVKEELMKTAVAIPLVLLADEVRKNVSLMN